MGLRNWLCTVRRPVGRSRANRRRSERSRYWAVGLLPVSAAVAMALAMVSTSLAADAAPAVTPLPALWNTFQSRYAITHSRIGPPLAFYSMIDCPKCGGVDVKATPGFAAGYNGNGLTIAPGNYVSEDREHNIVLRNLAQVLSINQGTISVWFKQNIPSVPYQNGVYRIFDGAFGLTSGFGLWVGGPRLYFDLSGLGNDVTAVSVSDNQPGVDLRGSTDWLHLVAVWDRTGIAGSGDTLRLYVNGGLAAISADGSWGGRVGNVADIGGGNDGGIANAFVIDRLELFTSPVLPTGSAMP